MSDDRRRTTVQQAAVCARTVKTQVQVGNHRSSSRWLPGSPSLAAVAIRWSMPLPQGVSSGEVVMGGDGGKPADRQVQSVETTGSSTEVAVVVGSIRLHPMCDDCWLSDCAMGHQAWCGCMPRGVRYRASNVETNNENKEI